MLSQTVEHPHGLEVVSKGQDPIVEFVPSMLLLLPG